MEDANARLFISKGSIPTIGWNNKEVDGHEDEEWEVLDRKALGTIRLSLAASVGFNISKEKTMKELMDALDKVYEKPSVFNMVFLIKQLFNMNMSKGGSVADHLNEFNMLTNQLSSVKVVFDDKVRDILILCSLP
jgi:hypothetical protein